MTVYIQLRAEKQWVDLLHSYLDKAFQIIFNDYDILVNGFWKYELKARADRQMLIWQFNNVNHKDYDFIVARIERVIPNAIDYVISSRKPYTDEYKEVK